MKNNFTTKKISYVSLGCKVNLYESVAIINKFIKNGFNLVDFGIESDVTIINTCTVTQMSDQKSRKMIRQAVKASPNGIICVMGCYSQLNQEEASNIDGVDIVVGTSNRNLLYELAINKINEKDINGKNVLNLCQSYDEITTYEDLSLDHYDNKTRGFVKIQDGCENFCSYCTIPYSRGKFRSRDKQSVINEINNLSNHNMKEIVLTGINTGAYGKDLNGYSFSSLLKDIIKEVPNLGKLRISSIEITEITDELIETIKNNINHFCNHLHVPLQGGSDFILNKMNRKYDTQYYLNRINYVRKMLPEINITADILVGFDGETDSLFEDAYNFIEMMKYGETHIFPYSPRIKTKAYSESKKIKFKDRVDGITLKNRVNILLELNKKNALEYRQQFIGKPLTVLVEKVKDGLCTGHTSNYLEVRFESKDNLENDLVEVVITKPGYPISFAEKI